MALAKPLPGAKYVGFSSGSYTVGLSLAEVEYSNVLIALRLNGKTLPHEHGGPCRLIATGKECHFSVKWIDRIDLRSSPAESVQVSGMAALLSRCRQQGAPWAGFLFA